ncbi:hypothetical protein ACH40E_17555 [Streptomyces acidicola]|uniref:hypothetical protein n=1 Tax=Streptomyces acidicola TaxID=2596892 RepID=UPI00379CDDBB
MFYAAVGALVRAELARRHTRPTHPPAEETAAPSQIVTPAKSASVAARPVPARRRLRARAAAVLHRLSTVRE